MKCITSSVQAKFTIAISFTVLLFFSLLLIISFTYFKNYSIDKSKEYASAILYETNAKINLFFSEIENLAESLANFNTVRQVDSQSMENIFLSTVSARKEYIRAIYLGTETGKMYEWGYGEGFINHIPRFPSGYDPRVRPWYKTAVESGKFSVSKPYIYASVKALGITGVIPVYSGDNRFVGVLGIDIILQGLRNIIKNLNTQHKSKIILLNKDFEILASQFDTISGNVTHLKKYNSFYKIKDKEGYFIDTIKKAKMFISYKRNQTTGWILLTAIPYHSIMEFSNNTIEVIFLTDMVLIFILVIIINILLRKIVTGHLESLTAVMKDIGGGNLKARVPVSGEDEFAKIGTLFNELAEIRETYTYRMEDAVKKRTLEVTKLQVENTRLRILEEKERIFRNLHDSLGARLTNIFISNNVARSASGSDPELLENMLGRIEKNTEAGIQDLKEIIFDHTGERLIIDFAEFFLLSIKNRLKLKNIHLKYKIKNKDIINSLPQNVRFEAEKILQELVTNVLKHSEASAVSIDIRALPTRLLFSFKDNGKGFDIIRESSRGYGLNSIRKRISKIGGILTIKSNKGNGAKFIISIPVKEHKDD